MALQTLRRRWRSSEDRASILSWLALGFGLLYVALGWLWKGPFIFGDVGGIYWLLIIFDWSALPLAGLTSISVGAALIALVIHVFRPKRGLRRQAQAMGILFAASLCFLAASFPAMVSPWI